MGGPRRLSRERWPYWLVLPAFALELAVHVVPLVVGVVISVKRLTPRELRDWTAAPYVGLDNYRAWWDPDGVLGGEVLESAGRTALYTVLVVGVSWLLGMAAALAVASARRGRSLWQAWFVVPFALPAFVTVLSWRFILDRDTGMLNTLLVDDLGLVGDRPFWLIGDNAFWSVVVVSVWRLWPFAFLVLAAALHAVPQELYSAAALDGASPWQRLRRITLPLTRRTSALLLLVMTLWAATDFSTPYLLYDADPPPQATLLGNLVYRHAFVSYDLGLASALNVMLTVVLVLGGVVAWQLTARRSADA
jgi:multiple sugar transport system permease protein